MDKDCFRGPQNVPPFWGEDERRHELDNDQAWPLSASTADEDDMAEKLQVSCVLSRQAWINQWLPSILHERINNDENEENSISLVVLRFSSVPPKVIFLFGNIDYNIDFMRV